jgi:hypothetical protein
MTDALVRTSVLPPRERPSHFAARAAVPLRREAAASNRREAAASNRRTGFQAQETGDPFIPRAVLIDQARSAEGASRRTGRSVALRHPADP